MPSPPLPLPLPPDFTDLGALGHELNNALAPIILSVELLRRRVADPDTQRQLDLVAGHAWRGAALAPPAFWPWADAEPDCICGEKRKSSTENRRPVFGVANPVKMPPSDRFQTSFLIDVVRRHTALVQGDAGSGCCPSRWRCPRRGERTPPAAGNHARGFICRPSSPCSRPG